MVDPLESGGHPQTTTAPLSVATASASRPEAFRLPSKGGDPHFGLSRSYYYEKEKLGWWKLIRLRERGKLRGITLVPYDAVSAVVRSHMERKEAAK
jgi:hypothetical protein